MVMSEIFITGVNFPLYIVLQRCLPGQAASLQLCVSSRSSFEHPWSHVRVLFFSPDPHEILQLDHSLQSENTKSNINNFKFLLALYEQWRKTLTHELRSSLPGQAASLQLCVSEILTWSWLEHPWVHLLVLVCSPDPHETLQLDQSLHVENT